MISSATALFTAKAPSLPPQASLRKPSLRRLRRGFSLVEVMVATVISLIVIGAAVSLFGFVGQTVTSGRAGIETSDRVRSAQDLLRRDLRSVTATMLPWESASAANGYFELIKGNKMDREAWITNSNDTLHGYARDILMFTIRSGDKPFVGRCSVTGGIAQSQVAEVVWFLAPATNSSGQPTIPATYNLYRRMFLVLPGMAPQAASSSFYESNDVSMHIDSQSGKLVANSLADLTYRENRFGHDYRANNYPYLCRPQDSSDSSTIAPFSKNSQRYGEDLVLSNVLGFDVKVWDPSAVVTTIDSNTPLVPSDPGYSSGKTNVSAGAFVDLNYANGGNVQNSYFASTAFGAGANKAGALAPNTSNQTFPLTWDSWSTGYEYYTGSNSFTAYGSAGNVASGYDDNAQHGVASAAQRQTSPPYPAPLRGVQVKIRYYEPVNRTIREVTVAETFLPD